MTTKEIQARIDSFPLHGTKEAATLIGYLLIIIEAMNQRIAALEASQRRTSNVADCLANGIKPD